MSVSHRAHPIQGRQPWSAPALRSLSGAGASAGGIVTGVLEGQYGFTQPTGEVYAEGVEEQPTAGPGS